MDNVVDNCGLLGLHKGITLGTKIYTKGNLWITVDDMWTNLCAFIRDNTTLSTIHRPITIKNFLYTFNKLGGTI